MNSRHVVPLPVVHISLLYHIFLSDTDLNEYSMAHAQDYRNEPLAREKLYFVGVLNTLNMHGLFRMMYKTLQVVVDS